MPPPSGRLVAMMLLAGLASCDAPPPEFEAVPEPEKALRPADAAGAVPAEVRAADYELSAVLDAETHQVEGRAVLTWRNATKRRPDRLPFHLYMNGFRAEDTAWFRTAGGKHRGNAQGKDVAWGYVDVKSMKLVQDGGVPVDLKFAEGDDPSIMTVELPAAVEPGATVKLEYTFTTQLPQVFARTGFHENFHMVAQWFPKIGVLEEEAGWRNHVFTVNDEFYADFGNYDVTLDVPEDMVVGASGIRVAEESAEGRTRNTYRAEMVHDFAWTAHPDYVEHWGEHDGIRIRQLIQPDHVDDRDAHMDAQKVALDSFQDRYGPYPW